MKTFDTRMGAVTAGALATAILLFTGTAAAQQERSLRIVDGAVYVDDRAVPPGELPDDLQLEGVTAHYTFRGDVRPVVQLGDRFYVLDGDRLRVAESSERDGFYFQEPPRIRDLAAPDVHVQFRTVPDRPPAPPHVDAMNRNAELLQERALRLSELQRDIQGRFDELQFHEVERLAQEMSRQALEAAQVARELPRIELETYLEDVRSRNDGLFDRLVDERALEHETIRMARQIRTLAEQERHEEVEALRVRLQEIFELRQENRRREVHQLERRLEDLEQKLTERERLREEIVERRLQELLEESEGNW